MVVKSSASLSPCFFGVRVSFDYRFGKMDFKQPKKKGIKNDDLKPGEDSNDMGGGMGGK